MKVRAKTSHISCGYMEGDILEIVKGGSIRDVYRAKNLTKPNAYGQREAIISSGNFEIYHEPEQLLAYKIVEKKVYKILGIPVYSKTTKHPIEEVE